MIILTDIHGNFDTMMALLEAIPKKERDKGIAICGDLIDRGPKSCQIVQWAIDNNIQCVKGNHEEMMIDWIVDGCNYDKRLWLDNGGTETLNSYKYKNGKINMKKLKKHALWMDSLPYYIEFPDIKNEDGRYLVISHSNIGNAWNYKDSEIGKSQIMWGRPYKIKDIPSVYNVIGHTPQEDGPRYRKIYSNIDTGCAYVEKGYGKLTALQFPEMIFYECGNIDMQDKKEVTINKLSLSDLKERKRRYKR